MFRPHARWLTAVVCALLCLGVGLLAACTPQSQVTSSESYVFGTRVEILVWNNTPTQTQAATSAVLAEFDRLHRTYHAWNPSPLARLNAALARGENVQVDAEMAAFLQQAQTFAAMSDYLFDPGIGKLIALWGFHDDNISAQLPDPAALAALVAHHPSLRDLVINGQYISSRNPALAIDLGGYLKGVALDRARAILHAHGINNALINIGGNVLALGSKGGTPWRVGIQHPRKTEPMAILDMRDGEAIGTSGDYQRYFEWAGKRYCHILDPRHGLPAQGMQSVTLLIPPRSDAGTWSDWASKPLFVAGSDWVTMAKKLGLNAVLAVDAQGATQMTPAFRARIVAASDPAQRVP